MCGRTSNLFGREGLLDEVENAHLETRAGLGHVPASGNDDDGDVLILLSNLLTERS
jgi:hypothetical protein